MEMAHEVRLPSLSGASDEIRVVEWLRHVGDAVGIDDLLLRVESEESQFDIESASAGVLLRILVQPGEVLREGDIVAFVGDPGDSMPASQRGDMTWH